MILLHIHQVNSAMANFSVLKAEIKFCILDFRIRKEVISPLHNCLTTGKLCLAWPVSSLKSIIRHVLESECSTLAISAVMHGQ